MDVILLERIGKLGHMGETVKVKDGYARNFLLPRGKALRATEANKKKFEAQRADLEARNLELKRNANEASGEVDGVTVVIIRQAGETGQLYGSVSARDIADALARRRAPGPAQPCRDPAADQDPRPAFRADPPPPRGRGEGHRQRRPLARAGRASGEGRGPHIREQTSMDDLGLEVGKALAEAGPGESLGRE